ncbi:hypothetical protein TrCOL_g297, partial [Triparma columacea]
MFSKLIRPRARTIFLSAFVGSTAWNMYNNEVREPLLPPRAVLTLDLETIGVTERCTDNVEENTKMLNIDTLTKAINKAGEDPRIQCIVVHMGKAKGMNAQQMHQLSGALREFKNYGRTHYDPKVGGEEGGGVEEGGEMNEKGAEMNEKGAEMNEKGAEMNQKRTIVYTDALDTPSNATFFLSSGNIRFLERTGGLPLNFLSVEATVPYWGGVFQKFGVHLDFWKRGRFKSMGSTFLQARPSVLDAHGYRYWMQDLADMNREAILENIPIVKALDGKDMVTVPTRKILEGLERLEEKFEAYKAESLRELGLVDGVGGRGEVEKMVKKLYPKAVQVPINKYVKFVSKNEEKLHREKQLENLMGRVAVSEVGENEVGENEVGEKESVVEASYRMIATPQVAVVRVGGGITRGRKSGSSMTLKSSDIIEFLKKAEKDKMVK